MCNNFVAFYKTWVFIYALSLPQSFRSLTHTVSDVKHLLASSKLLPHTHTHTHSIVIQLCSQNKFKLPFIPQAIKFLNVSDTYVAKLVKILPKIQGEWKSLHIVCLSFYVDVLVFMWLYECQVTSLASQIPYWGQINVSVFLYSKIQCIHILNAFLSSPWDLMVTQVFIKGLMCFLCPQTKYTV